MKSPVRESLVGESPVGESPVGESPVEESVLVDTPVDTIDPSAVGLRSVHLRFSPKACWFSNIY